MNCGWGLITSFKQLKTHRNTIVSCKDQLCICGMQHAILMIIGMVNLIRITAQKKKTHGYFVDYSRKIVSRWDIVDIDFDE